jgi:hypothetical protein
MLSIAVVAFLILVIAWMAIWAHTDPGMLVQNFAIATGVWAAWAAVAIGLIRHDGTGAPRSGLLA